MGLYDELVELLEREGLGRVALLRKVHGETESHQGGEYDPNDPHYWEGKQYLDYDIVFYKTDLMSAQLKTVTGTAELSDEVMYVAAKADKPRPTQNDAIVELVYNADGSIKAPIRIARIIPIDSILEYWGDENSKTVFYVLSSDRKRTGWRGVA